MREPSHARAASLALAMFLLVAGWLLFEYSSRPTPSETVRTEDSPNETSDLGQPVQASSVRIAPSQTPYPDNVNLTFKCARNGHISFGDKPCSGNDMTISVTATEKVQPRNVGKDLAQLQDTVAGMEASRLERDRRYAVASNSNGVSNDVPSREMQCQQIDEEIARIDSQLRQPHPAQWGDYLAGERRKLSNRRFSIGC